MPVNSESSDITYGHLLGGRVSYAQPGIGFRTGIEPVLLAAAVPARSGQRVIEAGTGAGAALLCLSARVAGIAATGVELDESTARLARDNASRNGFSNLEILTGDILSHAESGSFDHALANPPYHASSGTPPLLEAKKLAKMAYAGLFAGWIDRLGAALKTGGSLTLIIPVGALTDCLIAMRKAHCAAATLLPLWPKRDREAKLLMLRGVKGGRSGLTLHPGLVLHAEDGSFTPAAEAILRGGAALDLTGRGAVRLEP
jgi:tRNA1Val (adenine37-N6)-methyltransferase